MTLASPNPSGPVLLMDGVTRLFGRHPALVRASLSVSRGEVVALTGPNGAGKTTLLRVAATAVRPTFGQAWVQGHSVVERREAVRRLVGYLSHNTQLYEDLTSHENLTFWATLAEADTTQIPWALEFVGLLGEANVRVRALSNGQRQRLALARLLLRRPQLVLLDEPYAGLDEEAKDLVDGMIAEARVDGRAVVVVTHDADRRTSVSTRVVTMSTGRIVSDQLGGTSVDVSSQGESST